MLSLAAWRVVMQMDQNSTVLPDNYQLHIATDRTPQLKVDHSSAAAIPVAPAWPADDFDLLGEPLSNGNYRVGAIQNLQTGKQIISVWPLPAVSRSAATRAQSERRSAQ